MTLSCPGAVSVFLRFWVKVRATSAAVADWQASWPNFFGSKASSWRGLMFLAPAALVVTETGAEGSSRSARLHYVAYEVREAIGRGADIRGIWLRP
jgi:plasmid replication initiation protein